MLRTLSADEKLREEYLAREKAIMDHYASLKAAESEGIELGIERGKLQMVAQMLKDGMSIDLVCRYSGLSEEIIQKAIQE